MRGIAIIGGESPAPEFIKKIACGADILVAADSGLMAAEAAGLEPDWIIGDMDSLDDLKRLDKYPRERILRFPAEKDRTDTELALALLGEKGCNEIWISGGGGGRADHLYAILSLFEGENSPGLPVPDRWYPGNGEIFCLRERGLLREDLRPGGMVSVFPLGKGPWEAKSSGLKWPLDKLAWVKGGLGLSNIASNGKFEIQSISGRFLVIIPGESWRWRQ